MQQSYDIFMASILYAISVRCNDSSAAIRSLYANIVTPFISAFSWHCSLLTYCLVGFVGGIYLGIFLDVQFLHPLTWCSLTLTLPDSILNRVVFLNGRCWVARSSSRTFRLRYRRAATACMVLPTTFPAWETSWTTSRSRSCAQTT